MIIYKFRCPLLGTNIQSNALTSQNKATVSFRFLQQAYFGLRFGLRQLPPACATPPPGDAVYDPDSRFGPQVRKLAYHVSLAVGVLGQGIDCSFKIILRFPAPILPCGAVVKYIWPTPNQIIRGAVFCKATGEIRIASLDRRHEILGRKHIAVQIVDMLG